MYKSAKTRAEIWSVCVSPVEYAYKEEGWQDSLLA